MLLNIAIATLVIAAILFCIAGLERAAIARKAARRRRRAIIDSAYRCGALRTGD